MRPLNDFHRNPQRGQPGPAPLERRNPMNTNDFAASQVLRGARELRACAACGTLTACRCALCIAAHLAAAHPPFDPMPAVFAARLSIHRAAEALAGGAWPVPVGRARAIADNLTDALHAIDAAIRGGHRREGI